MLVYLAVPYSHPSASIRQERFERVNEVAARMMQDGIAVFSPISHSHPIEMHMNGVKLCWEFWQNQDLPILKACDELWVLTIDGWLESVGVTGEIEHAEALGIPIRYITFEEYRDATIAEVESA
jgi:hypothetical protein